METTFVNALVFIATGAAVVKFALLECEGILKLWRRVRMTPKTSPQRHR
jgi:hypothetical protein